MHIRLDGKRFADRADVDDLISAYCREEKGGIVRFTVLAELAWNVAPPSAAEAAGCYMIYSLSGLLIYPGMSESNVAKRIWRHRKSVDSGKSDFWLANPPFSYDVVLTPKPWDAPGLEAYITHKTYRYIRLRDG